MSFGNIINTTLIGPLKLTFEIIFNMAYRITQSEGFAIILMSLAINFLVLPLYRCADAMQERARLREAELHDEIKHIKKTFKGDERMMMLQTYYKQKNYSPLSALSGSVSLLLEIPFFIAAYQFLAHATVLSGASLGFIKDFGSPDALFSIGSFDVNVLPVLMTVLNIVASVLFLKGATLQSKIQLYAMAGFFLVFLYDSPSGLVFYWTLNNLFSLIKTIFYKLKNPRKVLIYVSSVSGVLFFLLSALLAWENLGLRIFSFVMMFVLQFPLLISYLKKYIKFKPSEKEPQPNKKVFLLGCLFISLLLGVFIPSTYLAAEPTEFIHAKYYKNPLWYIVSATCLSAGTFLVWFSVFYWLASPKGKVVFDRAIWIACFVMLVDYLFFGTNLGNISASLRYDKKMHFTFLEHFLNIVVILGLSVGMYFVITKFKRVTVSILSVAIIAVCGMSTVNIVKTGNGVRKYDTTAIDAGLPTFELSKTGQNVIVLMLDRALGAYFPYAMKEIEMRQANGKKDFEGTFLDGFTYYSNVISFGGSTNFGTPGLLGGYEYTPVEMNKRDDLPLAQKQNEANLLMPRVFTEQWEGCDQAYVFDPVYTNYDWISDLSVYDDYKDEIKARNVLGYFMDDEQAKTAVEDKMRNFYCFSLTKSLPLAVQRPFYQSGYYNKVGGLYSNQNVIGTTQAEGVDSEFLENYGNIVNLNRVTETTKEDVNRFMFMCNNVCHEPIIVNEETYDPYVYEGDTKKLQTTVDNAEYDKKYADRYNLDATYAARFQTIEQKVSITNEYQMRHYQTNVLALLKVNEWFNELKRLEVYDNTRIIVVSDHGSYGLNSIEALTYESLPRTAEVFMPLLLVKDFNTRGEVKGSSKFMTNADVPTLAFEGLIEAPVNPYTQKVIDNAEKTAHPQFIIDSLHWQTTTNNGNTFEKSTWLSVEKNIWEESNWSYHKKETVLKEHEAP